MEPAEDCEALWLLKWGDMVSLWRAQASQIVEIKQ